MIKPDPDIKNAGSKSHVQPGNCENMGKTRGAKRIDSFPLMPRRSETVSAAAIPPAIARQHRTDPGGNILPDLTQASLNLLATPAL
jgi:hypothetical protein